MTPSATGNQTASLVLTLSIGLQLLAFFVVLNATTAPDAARSRAVIASVQQSFRINSTVPTADQTAAANKSAAQVVLRSSISEAFNRVLDGRDIVVRSDGDVLWVKAPVAAFFEPETQALRAVLPVLDRIAMVLDTPPDGLRYEMLITISNVDGANGVAAVQAGALAADLLRRGFSPSSFSLGAVAALEPTVTLAFVVRAEDDQPLSTLIRGQIL